MALLQMPKYDASYLMTVARILRNERIGSNYRKFIIKVAPWLPVSRDPKTKEVLFPLPEDVAFVWLFVKDDL